MVARSGKWVPINIFPRLYASTAAAPFGFNVRLALLPPSYGAPLPAGHFYDDRKYQ